LSLLDQLRDRRDTARKAAEQILTRAADEGRDLTPDELAEHRQHVIAEREAADEADRVRDEQIAELRATTARRTGPPPTRGPVLTRAQSVEDWARTRGLIPDEEPLSFDRYLRGLATGNWDGAEHERALSEGTLTAGGHLVPTPLSARVIDLARNQTSARPCDREGALRMFVRIYPDHVNYKIADMVAPREGMVWGFTPGQPDPGGLIRRPPMMAAQGSAGRSCRSHCSDGRMDDGGCGVKVVGVDADHVRDQVHEPITAGGSGGVVDEAG
jgi:hypothetical protein